MHHTGTSDLDSEIHEVEQKFCQQIANTWKTRHDAKAAVKMASAYMEDIFFEVNQLYGELDFGYESITGVNEHPQ